MRTSSLLGSVAAGAAAGAAGASALNAVTYLDMVLRGRPASSTPEESVEKSAGNAHIRVPGDEDSRKNRVSGLGGLTGILTGVGVGATYGLVRGLGLRAPTGAAGPALAVSVMAMTDGSMTALGVTDPRTWQPADWLADLIPHLAYGFVTAAVTAAAEPGPAPRWIDRVWRHAT